MNAATPSKKLVLAWNFFFIPSNLCMYLYLKCLGFFCFFVDSLFLSSQFWISVGIQLSHICNLKCSVVTLKSLKKQIKF